MNRSRLARCALSKCNFFLLLWSGGRAPEPGLPLGATGGAASGLPILSELVANFPFARRPLGVGVVCTRGTLVLSVRRQSQRRLLI